MIGNQLTYFKIPFFTVIFYEKTKISFVNEAKINRYLFNIKVLESINTQLIKMAIKNIS